ncbi:MAG TPA: hypothetical protein VE523_02355 [Solirubrobacterales bacterium]|jgi:hypothetical protein|nr:hypothetical protein [Solirubrobacterales bacterium]
MPAVRTRPAKEVEPLLNAGLDPPAIARLTGRSTRTAERWANGETNPRGEGRKRLLALDAVVEALAAALPRADPADWLQRPNVELDFDSPAEAIEHGGAKRVLALLTAIGEGAYL